MTVTIETFADGAKRRTLASGNVYVGYPTCTICAGDGYYRGRFNTSPDTPMEDTYVRCSLCKIRFDPLADKKEEMRRIARGFNRLYLICWGLELDLNIEKTIVHPQIVRFYNIAEEVKKQKMPQPIQVEVIG